jgi:hypothetical protein
MERFRGLRGELLKISYSTSFGSRPPPFGCWIFRTETGYHILLSGVTATGLNQMGLHSVCQPPLRIRSTTSRISLITRSGLSLCT